MALPAEKLPAQSPAATDAGTRTGGWAASSASSVPRTVGRLALGGALAFAGVSHLTVSRQEFQAQVPSWVPLDPDLVVVASGVVEIALGTALLVTPRRYRGALGWLVAAFFVAIFPGNIAQLVERKDGFGLDTDQARAVRLAFQPLLVMWALWSTGAWRTWRERRTARAAQDGGTGNR